MSGVVNSLSSLFGRIAKVFTVQISYFLWQCLLSLSRQVCGTYFNFWCTKLSTVSHGSTRSESKGSRIETTTLLVVMLLHSLVLPVRTCTISELSMVWTQKDLECRVSFSLLERLRMRGVAKSLRVAFTHSSWFCLPSQGMKEFELLGRASAFLTQVKLKR